MKLSKALGGFFIAKAADGYSQNTLNLYQWGLELLSTFLKDPEAEKVTAKNLQSFMVWLQKDYKPNRPNGVHLSMLSGAQTGEFGYWLDNFINDKSLGYRVLYGHWDSEFENVGVIQGFVGPQPTRENTFAEVDVMVIDTEGNIKLLIEIEDKSSSSPKKLLGVLFSIVLCNKFAFGEGGNKEIFKVNQETQLLIAGFVNPKGRKREQIFKVLQPRISEIDTPEFSIRIRQVSLVFEKDEKTTIQALKEKVIPLLE